MARYKLLDEFGLPDAFWVKGNIYNSDLRRDPKWRSVEEMVKLYPKNWELIKENNMETLPKYWCINIKHDSKKIIKKWIEKSYPEFNWFFGLTYYGNTNHINETTGQKFTGHSDVSSFVDNNIEITVEEFKKFILNKNMEKTLTITLEEAKEIYGKSKEMDALLLANFSKEELTKKELPKNFSDLGNIGGYWINGIGVICEREVVKGESLDCSKPRFATEKQAKSALAMAQLSQLMKAYNGDWEPDWNSNNTKYCIIRERDVVFKSDSMITYRFLAFKTPELRDEFLKNFKDLIKQYLMID